MGCKILLMRPNKGGRLISHPDLVERPYTLAWLNEIASLMRLDKGYSQLQYVAIPYVFTTGSVGSVLLRWIPQQLHSKTVLAHFSAFQNKCTKKPSFHIKAT
jgi:hypothetical protein